MRLAAFFLAAGVAFGQAITTPQNVPSPVPPPYMHYAGSWSTVVRYNYQDVVIYASATYVSLYQGNTGNTPSSNSLFWRQLAGGTGTGGASVWGQITGTLTDQVDVTNALNGKEPTITAGLITQYWAGTKAWRAFGPDVISAMSGLYESPLSFGNGLSRTLNTITCATATNSTNGCLTATDWNTFNGKQAALGFTPAPVTRSISTSAPLQGGGTLANDIALTLPMWGSGTRPVAASALGVSGNCVQWSSTGLGDSGGPCGGTGTGGANSLGYYLVSQTANAPANAIDLSLLSNGLMKITVTAGVAAFSTAASGTDYAPATSGAVPLRGNGSGGFTAATASDIAALWTGTHGSAYYLAGDGTLQLSTTGTSVGAAAALQGSNGSGGFVDTGCTATGGSITCPGTVISGFGSGNAGADAFLNGAAPTFGSTPPQIPAAGYWGWVAPVTMTTSMLLQAPNASPPANSLMLFPAPTGQISQWSWVQVGTAANNMVRLNSSAQLPAVSAALLTNFPTLNQNTTGTAAGLTAAYVDWNQSTGGASILNKPTIYYQTTALGGLSQTQRARLNLIQGANVTLTFSDNAVTNSTDVTIASTGGGGGSGCVPAGAADFLLQDSGTGTCNTNANFKITGGALTLVAGGTVNFGAGGASSFVVPVGAGYAPTSDGRISGNTTNHTTVWGSGGTTTVVGAAAATGTNVATACTNQVVTTISGVAAPTCTTLTSAYLPSSLVYTGQANTYTAGMRQTFTASSTTAGIKIGGVSADPSAPTEGDIWYRSDLFKLCQYQNGSVACQAFGSNLTNPMTSVGDLIVGITSGTPARLGKGTQYQTLQGGASTPGYDAVHLDQATAVTGALPIANGGINASSAAAGTIPNATSGTAASWTPTPTLGVAGTTAGTLTLANATPGSAATTWGSAATTNNTILGFAAVPTTAHLIDCVVSSTTCTLHDSGLATANVVNASSPGVGIAHFAGSTQTVTSSLIVAADITSGTITGTQLAASLNLTTPILNVATATSINKVAITAPTTAGTIAFAADNSTATLPNGNVTVTVASGSTAVDPTSISSGACGTVVTATATGAASTDAIIWNANGSVKAVTGYVPASTGGMSVAAYPTTNTVNFEVCNWTAGAVDPGSITINWRVVR